MQYSLGFLFFYCMKYTHKGLVGKRLMFFKKHLMKFQKRLREFGKRFS